MNSLHKLNTLLLVTLLIAVNCMLAKSANTSGRISGEEEDYADDNEEPSQELVQPASTLLPFFESNNVTIWVKDLGTRLVLECPVKNFDDKEQILWFKEDNNIAVSNNVMSHDYEVDDKSFRLTIKSYNDNSTVSNYYCEVTPQKIRFHIMIKLGEGGQTPDQIQNVETPANGSMRFEGIHVYYLVCLLLTAIKLLPAV